MATFLRDPKALRATVMATQEPWQNEYDDTTHQPARATHQLLYPKSANHDGVRARVALYVSRQIDPATWSHTVISPDYQILKIRYARGDQSQELFIHNIYNEPGSATFEHLQTQLAHYTNPTSEHVIVGDMNVHHPAWGGPGTKMDTAATELLEIMDHHEIELATEEGLVTWQRGKSTSTIDLTFLSANLFNRMVLYERADNVQHDSDHWPIRTQLDIQTPVHIPLERRNWAATDIKKLHKILERELTSPILTNASIPCIELATKTLIQTVQYAIEQSIPLANPSEWSNPDFTPECNEAIRTCRRLRRQVSNTHNPWIWRAYLRARNQKKRVVSKALRQGHRRRVQEVTERGPMGMWRLAKWARSRKGAYESGITPTLQSDGISAESVEEKTALLSKAFFPQIPKADLSDIDNAVYPEQLYFPTIPRHEIETVIRSTPPDKAPGADAIPNSLWHKIIGLPVVLDTLYEIFNACVRTGYNPSHFQRSITVTLRKGGADRDYRMPKAYRPVALLNTLGKFLEAIIARRISYAVESEGLLPTSHLGGRKGISTDHTIQIILDRIQRAWGNRRGVVSMLLLDVSGAYDNAHHARLLHNMRKRRLGHFAPWVTAFLTGRSTKIRIPEGVSKDWISTPTGIPQGSPISPILYLIYNADLIEDCADPANHITTSGWVDDVSMMAAGYSERETIKKLERASATADQWALRHASVFNRKKYQLIHFVNPRSGLQPQKQPIQIQDDVRIDARNEVKYLGMRRIYQAVIIPQILYGTTAWFHPGLMTQKQITSTIKGFASIQKRAACLISSAFRTTAAEALNTELHLIPMRQQLDQLAKITAIQIRTGPTLGIPSGMLTKRTDEELTLGGYTPMEAHAWKKGGCLTAPPRTLAGRWESRDAYVQEPWREPPRVIINEREVAISVHNSIHTHNAHTMIYTDGSGYQGYIGAAAVIPALNVQVTECIGTEGTSTVYAGESYGISYALKSVLQLQQNRDIKAPVIFSDSQAALRTLTNPRMASGQLYIRECLRLLRECMDVGINATLRWIPGHENVPGNEMADRAAKKAAIQGVRREVVPGDVSTGGWIMLGAAAKRRIQQSTKDAWEKAWDKQKSGKPTKNLVTRPSRRTIQY
ncbi:uncharacterized protein BHQ10_010387 [Talaromyces amestolkiae]|uniref:Reverse transcriptase n=1 Tax=Talaromyces amestolkiae TaxID=1196081 RepID=A0A364LEX9_TALAM|nr:uncharacterized protein BHQ10_010387 [Talaromyces amestolkiae]RAO74375.1 hypothetical protein BHQ10_010387 [Talaromyces amestolkiae]